jgi:hypothetical protein
MRRQIIHNSTKSGCDMKKTRETEETPATSRTDCDIFLNYKTGNKRSSLQNQTHMPHNERKGMKGDIYLSDITFIY